MHDQAREEAMYSTRIVVDCIECLNHRNAAVRAKAALMCELGEFRRVEAYTCIHYGLACLISHKKQ